jgi:alkylhydroperoxidase/carboxymuconolactone decarboxylase family protein YurZ
MKSKPPKHYRRLKKTHPEFIASWDAIGKAVRDTGPLSPKTGHLIQLAAAAAVRSEGAVHSHVRRLIDLKAKPAEIRQAIMLTAATIGFPAVMAALSWADDILETGR